MSRQPYDVEGNLLRTDFRKGAPTPSLKEGGGGGTYDGMDARVTRLETHMEYVQRDLAEIKGDLKTAVSRLSELPTRSDLRTWQWGWIATGVAIIALTVGGITGGLALIAEAQAQPQQVALAVTPPPGAGPKPPSAAAKK